MLLGRPLTWCCLQSLASGAVLRTVGCDALLKSLSSDAPTPLCASHLTAGLFGVPRTLSSVRWPPGSKYHVVFALRPSMHLCDCSSSTTLFPMTSQRWQATLHSVGWGVCRWADGANPRLLICASLCILGLQ